MKRGEPPAGPTRNNLPAARYYRWRDPARAAATRALLARLDLPVDLPCDADAEPATRSPAGAS